MTLPVLEIGDSVAKIPIIQGGMAVGISLSGLASAVAEEVVFDADDLDRLGLMGMLRGMMVGPKDWSMEDIIENRLEKRKKDYQRLHFEASRELGRKLYEETLRLIDYIQDSLNQRCTEISKLNLPV